MPIADKTRLLLETAGWFSERRVDVTGAVAAVQSEGYSVCAVAREFLERFSGLYVEVPHPNFPSRIRFEIDPSEATGMLDHEEILPAEEQLGEALTPVGSYEGCYSLFMGTNGSLYGIYDEILVLFGRDWQEALNAMCLEGKAERLPDWK